MELLSLSSSCTREKRRGLVWETLFVSLKYDAPECTAMCVEKLLSMDLSPQSALEYMSHMESLTEEPEIVVRLRNHFNGSLNNIKNMKVLSPSLVSYLVVEKKAFRPYKAYEMTMEWADEYYYQDDTKKKIIPAIDFTDMSGSELESAFKKGA